MQNMYCVQNDYRKLAVESVCDVVQFPVQRSRTRLIERVSSNDWGTKLSDFINNTWYPLEIDDASRKPSTLSFYRSMSRVITGYFRDRYVEDITSDDIRRFLTYLRTEYKTKYGNVLKPKSVKDVYNVMSLIFSSAYKRKIVKENPMTDIKCPHTPKTKVQGLTSDEVRRVYQASFDAPLAMQCMLLLFMETGIRRGECVGLQWQDVDFKHGTLTIQRAVTRSMGNGVKIGTPKTESSKRTVPLTDTVLDLLKRLHESENLGSVGSLVPEAYIFHRRNDVLMPTDPSSVTDKIKRFMKKAGLSDYSPHDLRRTFATYALSHRANIRAVQDMMGHTDSATTLNYYVKSDMAQMKAAIDVFSHLSQ